MHLILFGLQEPDAESKAKVYEKKPNYTKKTGCRSCVKKLGHWAETMRCRWCQRSQHSIEFGISVHLLFFILRCPSFVSLFMAEWAIQGMIISRRQYFLYSMKNMERDVNERRYNRRREEKKKDSPFLVLARTKVLTEHKNALSVRATWSVFYTHFWLRQH